MSLPDPSKMWEVTTQLSEKLFNAVLFYHDQLYDSYIHYMDSMNVFARTVIVSLMMLCCIMVLANSSLPALPKRLGRASEKVVKKVNGGSGGLGQAQIRNIVLICFFISIIRPVVFSSGEEAEFKFAGVNKTTIKDFDLIIEGLHFQQHSIDSIIESIQGMISKFKTHCQEFFCTPHVHEQLTILSQVLEQSREMTTSLTTSMKENIHYLKETIKTAPTVMIQEHTSSTDDIVERALEKIAEKRAQDMTKILKKDVKMGRQIVVGRKSDVIMMDPNDFIFKSIKMTENSDPRRTMNRRDGRKIEEMQVVTAVHFGQENRVLRKIEEKVDHILLELQELVIKNKQESAGYLRTAQFEQRRRQEQGMIEAANMPVRALIKKLTRAQNRMTHVGFMEKALTAIPALGIASANFAIENAKKMDIITEEDATNFQLYLGQMIQNSEDLGKILGNNAAEASAASDRLLNHLTLVRGHGGKGNVNFNLGLNVVKLGRTYRKLKEVSFDPASVTNAPLFFFIYIVILFHNKVTFRLLKMFSPIVAMMIMLPFTMMLKKKKTNNKKLKS